MSQDSFRDNLANTESGFQGYPSSVGVQILIEICDFDSC